ncbi:MAG: hypothetical protein WC895_05015 [Candidatus Shapirobacteria bacterium]|jgi:hypothetical protein
MTENALDNLDGKSKITYIGKEFNRNDSLEKLKDSGIIEYLEILRDSGQVRWSNTKAGRLPENRDPRGILRSTFLKPKTENPDIDYEPARIYLSDKENKTAFVSILFNGSKEEKRGSTVPGNVIKCSEARFGIVKGELSVLGFGTEFKPMRTNDKDFFEYEIVNAIKDPNFKNISLNK